MKITLHKPQREAANSVLAYEDEDWVDEYECEYFDDYFCDTGDICEYKIDMGDCTEYTRFGVINGESFNLEACA